MGGNASQCLEGDRVAAVEDIARTLGVADWRGGLKPTDKVEALRAIAARGGRVLMVGDGLNDAPALAAAHVSMSPTSGTDITQSHADAVFMGDLLGPVGRAIEISVLARSLMRENLALAIAYNAIATPLAMMGFVTPLIAAAAMSGSSILVCANAMRARIGAPDFKWRREAPPPATYALALPKVAP